MKYLVVSIRGANSTHEKRIKKDFIENYVVHGFPEGEQDIIDNILYTSPDDLHIQAISRHNPEKVNVEENGKSIIFYVQFRDEIPTRWLATLLLIYFEDDIEMKIYQGDRLISVGYKFDEFNDPTFDYRIKGEYDEALFEFFAFLGNKRHHITALSGLPFVTQVPL